MEAQELEILMQNNILMYEMVSELKEIRKVLAKPEIETDLCSPAEALKILGVNNVRYLTHFSGAKGGYLLNRRKGGQSYMYFKSECYKLAEKIKENPALLPNTKQMYAK